MKPISIWLTPSETDYKYLKNIIDDLSHKYDTPSFAPHLTIYGDVNTEPEIIHEAVKESIRNTQPFKIFVGKLNYSEFFFKTIFIEFQENEMLDSIYRKLREKLGKYGDYAFKPHISLLYKKLSEEKKLGIIKELRIKNEFTMSRITAVTPRNKENGWYDIEKWQVLFTEPLKSL